MTKKFRPMLAETVEDITKLTYPLYASPKLDGIRAMVKDGVLVSRTLKPIPNHFTRERFSIPELEGLDGELICGPVTAKDVFRQSHSAVMKHDGEPDVWFYVFDRHDIPDVPYKKRYQFLLDMDIRSDSLISPLEQTIIRSPEELDRYEQDILSFGFEGVITRSMNGLYKYGRSTLKQEWLLKLKRFSDSEAVIIGFTELMHNDNQAVVNEMGLTERGYEKGNLRGGNTLGAFTVEDIKTGVQFDIGTGFTAEQRQEYWNDKDNYLGSIVKYKYFEVGVKDKPRHPVFLGFRHPDDM